MSTTSAATNKKPEPLNSKAKVGESEVDYKKEYLALLEYLNDVGLQFLLNYKNIRVLGFTNWQRQQQQPPQTGGISTNT
jgi:hypothetical protein